MNKDKSFKGLRIAVGIGSAAAFAVILLACLLPRIKLMELQKRVTPLLRDSIEYVQNEKHDAALLSIGKMLEIIEDRAPDLMLMYDHSRLEDLEYAAKTALELAKAEDKTQLLTELTLIEIKLKYMQYSNEISLKELL